MRIIYQWENFLPKVPVNLVVGIVVVAMSIGIGGQAAAREMPNYPTVKNPENFDINWTGFYHEGNRRAEQIQKKFPNEIDVAYGDLQKQRLDLYILTATLRYAASSLFHLGNPVPRSLVVVGSEEEVYLAPSGHLVDDILMEMKR